MARLDIIVNAIDNTKQTLKTIESNLSNLSKGTGGFARDSYDDRRAMIQLEQLAYKDAQKSLRQYTELDSVVRGSLIKTGTRFTNMSDEINKSSSSIDLLRSSMAALDSGARYTTLTGRVADKNRAKVMDDLNKEMQAQQHRLGELQKMQKSMYPDQIRQASAFDKIKSSLHQYAAAYWLATEAFNAGREVFEFAREGAQFQRMVDTGKKVAEFYGTSMDKIVQETSMASMHTVSDYDLILGASQGMMFGVRANSDQFGKLMEVAALRGRAFGISTSKAYSDILRGIGRLSPLILDNIGITINASQTYEDYAAGIGKAADELSPMEKRQALFNRVLEEGETMLEETGGLVWDNAAAFEYMGAQWTNFYKGAGALLSRPISALMTANMVEGVGATLVEAEKITMQKYLKDLDDVMGLGGRTANEIGQEYLDLEKELLKENVAAIPVMDEKIRQTMDANQELRDLMTTTDAYGRVSRMSREEVEKLIEEGEDRRYEILLDIGYTDKLIGAYDRYQKTLDEIYKSKSIRKKDKPREYADAFYELSETVESMVLNMVSLAGASKKFQFELAGAFGAIDEKSLAAFFEIEDILKNIRLTGAQQKDLIMKVKFQLEDPSSTAEDIGNVFPDVPINITLDKESARAAETELDNLAGSRISTIYIVTKQLGQSIAGSGSGGGRGVWRALQHGGYAFRNSPYIVGEAGPELFVPSQSGTVLSADKSKKIGGGSTYHFYNKVTFVVEGGEVNMTKLMKQIGVG